MVISFLNYPIVLPEYQVVSDRLSDSLSILSCLQQRLLHSSVIVHDCSSVDHKLNLALLQYRASLTSIGKESDDSFVLVDKTDEAVNWVVVACYWLKNCVIPGLSEIKNSFLCLKAHRVCIEGLTIEIASVDV